MKKLVLAMLFMPLLSKAQQNIVSVERVFPKADKVAEFEKALAAHVLKYHTGTWKWRVFEITSGPDYGGYHITEGPLSWDDIEKRGDLGAEHTADWNKNIAPLITDKTTHSYSAYIEELSSVAISDYSDWINVTRLTPNPGYTGELRTIIANIKKVWVAGKSTVAVYSSSSSGPPGFAMVTRYKQGLKERAEGFRPPFRDEYEKIHGRDSWAAYQESVKKAVQHSTSELLRFRADLSSK